MTQAGIIVPMKATRGVVWEGKVRLDHPLPDGEVVYVRVVTDAEKAQDTEVMAELMAEMEPFRILNAEAYACFERHLEEVENEAR